MAGHFDPKEKHIHIDPTKRIRKMESDATMNETIDLLHKEERVETRGVYGKTFLVLRAEDIKNNVTSALAQNSQFSSVNSDVYAGKS